MVVGDVDDICCTGAAGDVDDICCTGAAGDVDDAVVVDICSTGDVVDIYVVQMM